MTSPPSTNASRELPPYLRLEQTLEPEDIPLQVLLLTMELAEHRKVLLRLTRALEAAAEAAAPPAADLEA